MPVFRIVGHGLNQRLVVGDRRARERLAHLPDAVVHPVGCDASRDQIPA
jgi:hypothetical protein